jgi:hypothetical protein
MRAIGCDCPVHQSNVSRLATLIEPETDGSPPSTDRAVEVAEHELVPCVLDYRHFRALLSLG